MDISGHRMSDNFEDRGNTDVVAAQLAPFMTNRLRDIAGTSPLFYDNEYNRLTVNIHARSNSQKIIRLQAHLDSFGSVGQLSPVLSNLNILPANDEVAGELLNDSISYQNESQRTEVADFICEEIFGESYSASVQSSLEGRRNLLGPGYTLDTIQCRFTD